MVKSLVGALALASLPSVLAFRNTSPFFLFSTADLNIDDDNLEVSQSTYILNRVTKALENCPSKTYFVVRQEGVSSADYLDDRSAPRLGRYLSRKTGDVKSTVVVPEVLDSVDASLAVSNFLQDKCSAEPSQVDVGELASYKAPAGAAPTRVIEVSLPAPPTTQRSDKLNANDFLLERLIEELAGSQDFTVIYTTTPQTDEQAKSLLESQHTYEMENPFGEAVQMELKRDLSSHKRASSKEGGLFEKYQYFSPGLFMGFATITPLFFILLVGLRALSSLEVSYFAFSKEMGPSAQRKQ